MPNDTIFSRVLSVEFLVPASVGFFLGRGNTLLGLGLLVLAATGQTQKFLERFIPPQGK